MERTSVREPLCEWLSAADAARELRVSVFTVRGWARAGLLPSYDGGRARLFRGVDVEKLRKYPRNVLGHVLRAGRVPFATVEAG